MVSPQHFIFTVLTLFPTPARHLSTSSSPLALLLWGPFLSLQQRAIHSSKWTPWLSMGCREICFGAWNIFFPPSSVALIFPGWLLFLPPSLLTLLVWHFPFLKHFLRGSLSLAGGAQLCPVADGLEPAGNGHVQHNAVPATAHRPSLQPLLLPAPVCQCPIQRARGVSLEFVSVYTGK